MSDEDPGLEGQAEAGAAPQFPDEDQLEATRRIAYCLSIDMVGSTEQGLSLTSPQLARFNKALVRQIVPYINGVGLAHALLKFTGDGWLVVTHDLEDVEPLCCLATIMAAKCRDEIARLSDLSPEKIPPLRLAIGSGRDLHVRLPKGQLDYVGDSARRATRAMQWCQTGCEPAEVLICEAIRDIVGRDFDGPRQDVTQIRERPKKWEENFALYVLGDPRAELVGDADAPDCYAYLFGVMGRTREAANVLEGAARAVQAKLPPPGLDSDTVVHRWNRLLAGVSSYAEAERVFGEMRESGSVPDVYSHSILMAKAPSYGEAEQWFKAMKAAGVAPDVVSYNTLVSKAPSYGEAEQWFKAMKAAGVAPDVVSYNTLISKAPSYGEAEQWFKAMKAAGVAPDVFSYSTLVSKAPSYGEAEQWFKAMKAAGVAPDVVSYNTLISKAPSYGEAERWLEAMEKAGVAPNVVSYSTLISKAPSYGEAERWLEAMEKAGVPPDVVSYNTLMSKAPSYAEAEKWFEAMGAAGAAPDVFSFSTLMAKASTYAEAKAALEAMEAAGVAPDVVSYTTLTAKASSREQAQEAFQRMIAAGVRPNERTYSALRRKGITREEAEELVRGGEG